MVNFRKLDGVLVVVVVVVAATLIGGGGCGDLNIDNAGDTGGKRLLLLCLNMLPIVVKSKKAIRTTRSVRLFLSNNLII